MSRCKVPGPTGVSAEVAAVDALAARLRQRMRAGTKVVYCTGSLTRLCGEYRAARTDMEHAWRRLRATAQEAEAEGRAALFQHRLADGEVEYLAVGTSARARDRGR
jgi:hypothetical protein